MGKPVLCVVGAGTTGLEALLAAREELGPGPELRLIAPEREFRYRPMSAGSLFRPAKERSLAIADLVAESGATWFMDRVEVVREAERSVLTRDGDTVEFDFLLPAPGKRSARANLAVAVPRGARWPVPARRPDSTV